MNHQNRSPDVAFRHVLIGTSGELEIDQIILHNFRTFWEFGLLTHDHAGGEIGPFLPLLPAPRAGFLGAGCGEPSRLPVPPRPAPRPRTLLWDGHF